MSPGKPPSRDWRAHPPTKSVYAREWRGTSNSSSSKYSRGFKLRLVGIGLFLLVGLIAVLLVPMAGALAKTQLLTFGIGAYGGQTIPRGIVPVNPLGEQDAAAFRILHDRNPAQFPEVRGEVNSLNGDQFLEFWSKERSSDQLARQNLVVFCTMHGQVQPSGEVKLFAIDATPENRGKMIPLNDLINLLQESPARRVLLLLDSARLESKWRLGTLSNDIAEQIASEWPATEVKRPVDGGNSDIRKVSILLAASPGQLSWPKENQSAFVHFVIQGLLGAADGWEKTTGRSQDSGRHDQRISLHELTEYARQQIEDWSLNRFGTVQSIMLLGNIADFDVASTSQPASVIGSVTKIVTAKDKLKAVDAAVDETSAKKDESISKDQLAELKWDPQLAEQLWKSRDHWRDETSNTRPLIRRIAPLAWRQFQANLALAESLNRGGQEKLAVAALQQAEALSKLLTDRSAVVAGLNWSKKDSQSLQSWGFFFDPKPPAPEAIAAAGKKLLGDLASAGKADAAAATDPNAPATDFVTIREWVVQELRREGLPEKDRDQLRQIVDRLPLNPDGLFLRDVLSVKATELPMEFSDAVPQYFALWDRFRRIAMQTPGSWPLVESDIRLGLRALNAAQRWMFAPGTNHPLVKDWLRKADEAAVRVELIADRYREAIGTWNDLLIELPAIAEWVATRANDDDHRSMNWLRTTAKSWIQQQQDRRWEPESLSASWSEKPRRLTDLERRVLSQFVDAQRLKFTLFASREQKPSTDLLAKLAGDAKSHTRDFWQEFHQMFSPGELSNPPPAVCRESYRLLEQPWLPLEERTKFDLLQRDIESRSTRSGPGDAGKTKSLSSFGDSLPNRPTTTGSLWQGFWSLATADLLSRSPGETAELWKDWDRLFELTPTSDSQNRLNDTERSDLRRKRAELGQKIHEQLTRPATAPTDLPTVYLLAATQDPFIIPENDPDAAIQTERKQQFGMWLSIFADEWRSRVVNSTSASSLGYAELAQSTEGLVQELLHGRDRPVSPAATKPLASTRIQEVNRPTFNGDRHGQLAITASGYLETGSPIEISLVASHARLVDGNRPTALDRGVVRPLPASGKLTLDLILDETVDAPQTLLVILRESDGYPLDFRQVYLNPPFDPKQWRIEFAEAATQNPLETEPLSRGAGVKAYLSPSTSIALRASLIRPKKDATQSAKIAVYRFLDYGRPPQKELLGEIADVKLEPGQVRTPITWDFPVPPKEKEKSAKDDAKGPSPVQEIGQGLLFEITPEGQPALEYVIRPTFYSALNFINQPKPVIADNRLSLSLERPVFQKEGLLPKKIPVELHVPDAFRKGLADFALSGSVEMGQQLTLSFPLPKNWADLARTRQLKLALDVAGLPHAYVWNIETSGQVAAISGQPPFLDIRMLLPPPEGKNPPRVKPVILAGKEAVGLQFQLNATELDRIDARGDWILKYTVSRDAASGLEATPLQNSWQLYSSLQRQVLLEGVQGGNWKIQTRATDFQKIESESEVRGLSGRFLVQADVIRADDPRPLATTKYRFAIDDDKPPELKVAFPNHGPKLIDRDLIFQIAAADPESGIQRIAYGFDLNGDGVLQEAKELLGESAPDTSGGIDLDPTKIRIDAIIPKSKLPPLAKDKDEEPKDLILVAQNGIGVVTTIVETVTLRKPPKALMAAKDPVCNLVVKLKVNRGAKSSVQITGPDSQSKETDEDSVTFSKIKPGRYEIKVKVNYRVVGISEVGEQTLDIKADETKNVEISLSAVKK